MGRGGREASGSGPAASRGACPPPRPLQPTLAAPSFSHGGAVVARFPFEPFALLRSVAQRGLGAGAGVSDCGHVRGCGGTGGRAEGVAGPL